MRRDWGVALPTLAVVSGPAGTGKTTLAHDLASTLRCPAICRDEIKEGMVFTAGEFAAAPGDELTARTLPLFFGLLAQLVHAGVSVVAEAAFQDQVWRPNLGSLSAVAQICLIQCHTDEATARRRVQSREPRGAHADAIVLDNPRYFDDFRRVTLDVPSIVVDTTDGYDPSIDAVAEFIRRSRAPHRG